MNVRFFDNRRVRQGLTVLLLAGALTCIFPPEHPAFQWWAERAAYVAMGLLLLGLFFLIINNTRLMFVCLGCSAAISFFKHEISDMATGNEQRPPLSRPMEAGGHQESPDSFLLKPVLPDEPSKTR